MNFYLVSPNLYKGWEPEILAPTQLKNLVKNTLDFQNAKKIGNALKNIICTALGPFQLRLGLVRLGIDTPPLDWGQNAKG